MKQAKEQYKVSVVAGGQIGGSKIYRKSVTAERKKQAWERMYEHYPGAVISIEIIAP